MQVEWVTINESSTQLKLLKVRACIWHPDSKLWTGKRWNTEEGMLYSQIHACWSRRHSTSSIFQRRANCYNGRISLGKDYRCPSQGSQNVRTLVQFWLPRPQHSSRYWLPGGLLVSVVDSWVFQKCTNVRPPCFLHWEPILRACFPWKRSKYWLGWACPWSGRNPKPSNIIGCWRKCTLLL